MRSPTSHRAVATWGSAKLDPASHEACTLATCGRQLAAALDLEWAGELDGGRALRGPYYLVPRDTLVGKASAQAIGVRNELDFFGGLVPHAFVATKTITHRLVDARAVAPAGWSAEFSQRVADVVLGGFSAFSKEDAWRGGQRLLEGGDVRVKPALATGGCGQSVAHTQQELAAVLQSIDEASYASEGVVIERDLDEVTTYSVGQMHVAGSLYTYCGTQSLTANNQGQQVYGGSTLTFVRGDFDELMKLGFPEAASLAVAQARHYDDAAVRCYGLLASRRNYDVARGTDPAGRTCSGVLEQSWRLGGATGAELCALHAFKADPALRSVGAATVEIYGDRPSVPEGAIVYFRGIDRRIGALTKYALIETRADTG